MHPDSSSSRHVPRQPIVVGYDGSPSSRLAAAWAATEAATTNTPLRLAHVQRWPLPELRGLDLPHVARNVDHARQAASDVLAAGVQRCREMAPTVDVRGTALVGRPVDLLTKLAADASLVVVGASGQTGAPQVLLGSAAAELTRRTRTPVAVIRSLTTGSGGARPVVIGVDGSTGSAAALEAGFDHAARRGLDVVAVHSWSDLPLETLGTVGAVFDPDRAQQDAAALLTEQLAGVRHRYPGVRVREVVRLDRPAKVLLDHAAEAALLVVGRHGRAEGSQGSDTPLGSVCHAVLHYAPCPVLLAA